MAKLTNAEIIDAIKELTVMELNDLVKACEEEFGVSAAAGVAVVAAGPAEAVEDVIQYCEKISCDHLHIHCSPFLRPPIIPQKYLVS